MKLLVAIQLLMTTFAFAQGPAIAPPQENSVQELVEAVKAAEANAELHQEAVVAPKVESVEVSDFRRNIKITLSNDFEFELNMSEYPSSVTYAFDALSREHRERFLEMREWALKQLSRLLSRTYVVPGITMIVKDGIYFVGRKTAPLRAEWREHFQRPTADNMTYLFPEDSIFRREDFWRTPVLQFNTPEGSYRARIYAFIVKTLATVDRAMINALKIKGVGLEITPVFSAGLVVGKLGSAVTIPRHLTIGFNWAQRAVIMRSAYSYENVDGGLTFGLGVGLRAAIYWDILPQNPVRESIVRGRILAPPGPETITNFPDRGSFSVGLGAPVISGALTTYFSTGSIAATILATAALAGWDWAMFSYSTTSRADLREIRITSKGTTNEVLAGRGEVERVKRWIWEIVTVKTPAKFNEGLIAAGSPRETYNKWAQTQNQNYKAPSCNLIFKPEIMLQKVE